MKELIGLLDKIAQDKDFESAILDGDEDSIRKISDTYFQQFKDFYSRVERHRYSDISKHLERQMQDAREHLLQCVRCIVTSAHENGYDVDNESSDCRKCYDKIYKLYDHIELEIARYSSLYQISLLADRQKERDKTISESETRITQSVKDAEEKVKKLSEQVISILGIFAGIIVTFSFATTVVGETVTNMAKGDVMHLCFVISLLGLIFINVIGLLMSFVGKLSGHRIQGAFPWAVYGIGSGLVFASMIFFYCNM